MSKGKKHAGDAPGQGEIQPDGSTAPATQTKAPPLTPRQRFQAHAERRASDVLKALKRLGNLANRKSYESTDEEVAQMLSAVDVAHKKMRGAFLEPLTADKSGGFRFSGWGASGNGTPAS